MVIHQAPVSLSTGGYGQSNTLSHIVAVCSLQLPPPRTPAIKLATRTFFFLVFGAQVQAFPLELKVYCFAQILEVILWSSGLRNRSLFFLGEVKQLHGEWGLKLISVIPFPVIFSKVLDPSMKSLSEQCSCVFLSVNMSCSRVFSPSLGSQTEADCRVQTTAQNGQKSPITTTMHQSGF